MKHWSNWRSQPIILLVNRSHWLAQDLLVIHFCHLILFSGFFILRNPKLLSASLSPEVPTKKQHGKLQEEFWGCLTLSHSHLCSVLGGLCRFSHSLYRLTTEECMMFDALLPEALALISRLKKEFYSVLQEGEKVKQEKIKKKKRSQTYVTLWMEFNKKFFAFETQLANTSPGEGVYFGDTLKDEKTGMWHGQIKWHSIGPLKCSIRK